MTLKPNSAPTVSDVEAPKRAARAAKRISSTAQASASKKREDRLIQLAAMPGGRGAKEHKRISAGGSLKETSGDKKKRQRKAQLAGMKKSRSGKDAEREKRRERMKKLGKTFG